MKRLIVRRQVIDCGADTCGRCAFLDDFENACNFWVRPNGEPEAVEVTWNKKTKKRVYLRRYQCKNAEVREK